MAKTISFKDYFVFFISVILFFGIIFFLFIPLNNFPILGGFLDYNTSPMVFITQNLDTLVLIIPVSLILFVFFMIWRK